MKDIPEFTQEASKSNLGEVKWQEENILIYGTGSFARDIQLALEKNGTGIYGFLDHRSTNDQVINNLPVHKPDGKAPPIELRKKSLVILGIHNREVNLIPIINNLKTHGYNRELLSPIDLYDHFAEELGTRYWLTSRTYYSSYTEEIQAVYKLLSDENSRKTFESLIHFRISGDYSLLPEPDTEHQYFPLDLPMWPQPIRFVDCGAYDGDTLHSLLQSKQQFEAIAAFEPDQDNFRKLSAYASKSRLPNISLFPCGVYSSTTQLTFNTGKGEGSSVSQTGKTTVQCVALDECIPTFRPTLIKMDIEGAEMDALAGACQLIKEYHPALAISAYHTPAHLWEIPLWINQLATENNLHYTYHYRAHAHNCFETIFYAIPQKEQA